MRGDEALRSVTLVGSWTFKQVRAALQKAEQLAQDTQGLGPDLIMKSLERPDCLQKGRFYPDTYTTKGSSDLAVLKRALRAMDRHLDAVWQTRRSDTTPTSPDQLLTLASLVEKRDRPCQRRPER